MNLLTKIKFILSIFILHNSAVHSAPSRPTTKGFELKLTKSELKESAIRLYIFTSGNKNRTITISYDQLTGSDRLSSICDALTKPLKKFIVHGFSETWNMTNRWNWVEKMIAEMMKTQEATELCVIVLDWKELANGGSAILSNYWKAISNMQIAGDLLTEFLRHNAVEEENMHCIGFSLGCHMCSIFYKIYFKKFNKLPQRLTGLDPAGPFFEDKPLSEKLNYQDAVFVDIIHTSDKFGLSKNLGHMDFYQDSGPSKVKACDQVDNRATNLDKVILYEEANKNGEKFEDVHLTKIEEVNYTSLKSVKSHLKSRAKSYWRKIKSWFITKPKRIFLAAHQFFGCSHIMAVRYFIYSINTCTFQAVACKDLANFQNSSCTKNTKDFPRMGYHAHLADQVYKTSRENFYVHTNETAPYCLDPVHQK